MAKTTPPPAAPKTWHDAVDRFVIHLTESEKSPNTVRAYLSDLLLFQSWYVDQNQETPALDMLDAAELREWKASMAALQPQSVNRRLAAIQSLIRFGESQGWCSSVHGPRSVRQETPPPRWLSKKEQNALVRAVGRCRSPRDVALIAVLLHVGLRISEAASLRWSMLELSPRKGSVTVIGKGRKQRTIFLNADVRAALLEHAKAAGLSPLGRDLPVFKGREGQYTANALWRIVTLHGRAAGLDADFSPHVLRHTFCRRLAEKGVRLKVIAALAGHESIETTRRYVEPGAEDLRAAVELLAGGED